MTNCISVNIVLLTANLLTCFQEKDEYTYGKIFHDIILQCFESLADFCLKPCVENQIILCLIIIILKINLIFFL